MDRETGTARTIQRIAAELGVPVSSFYEQDANTPSDHEAMQKAVAALLSAFAAVLDPEERRRCLSRLDAEATRLRILVEDSEC
ncbi:hypothetical protein [Methylobacterium sp. DCY52]|jgi:transcriptional regulator with XRE-family HTH domain|uniref:hypothetical protein n=1 Tax=Methylobacterium sp. DCY52 TaxID=739139 RepID=UPI003144D5F3